MNNTQNGTPKKCTGARHHKTISKHLFILPHIAGTKAVAQFHFILYHTLTKSSTHGIWSMRYVLVR